MVADLIEKSAVGDKEKNAASANYLRNRLDHEIMKCMVDVLKVSITTSNSSSCYCCCNSSSVMAHIMMIANNNKYYAIKIL